MAIHRSTDADGFTVTFVLSNEDPVTPVSVVGSFNDWTPGADPFEADADGSRSVTIVLPPGTDVHFRYLGPDGFWFDDPEADEITAEGSVLRAPATSAETAAEPAAEPAEEQAEEQAVAPAAAADEEPVAGSDQPSTSEEDQPETAGETGDRLATVADRISSAKTAAQELVDLDVLDPDAVDGSTTASVDERSETAST